MALVLVTPPSTEPISLSEAKTHLRVENTDDDTFISALITAARETVETITRRALVTQTWDYILDDWPDGDTITLPLPPLQSVVSVTYKDKDGNIQTFANSNYVVDTASEPGRLVLTDDANWPSDELYPAGAITVEFTAGYGAATAVPQSLKQAMLLLIGHWYENREAVAVTGAIPKEMPLAVDALLWPYRMLRWP